MSSSLSLIISSFSFKVRYVTLHFTQTFKGHCRLVNWPKFNIIVCQGIGKPKEREKDGGIATQKNSSVQFSSVAQCPTLCDPMGCSRPGFPVQHQLLELTQTHDY